MEEAICVDERLVLWTTSQSWMWLKKDSKRKLSGELQWDSDHMGSETMQITYKMKINDIQHLVLNGCSINGSC